MPRTDILFFELDTFLLMISYSDHKFYFVLTNFLYLSCEDVEAASKFIQLLHDFFSKWVPEIYSFVADILGFNLESFSSHNLLFRAFNKIMPNKFLTSVLWGRLGSLKVYTTFTELFLKMGTFNFQLCCQFLDFFT